MFRIANRFPAGVEARPANQPDQTLTDMDRIVSTANFRTRRAPLAAFVLMSLLLLGVTSCGRDSEVPGYRMGSENVTLTGQATLLCSDQCRGSSQCGTTNTEWVILANSSGPATQGHDLTFPANAQVTILANQAELLQSVSDPNRTQRMMFYAVEVPDRGAGWVAGWCIGQQIVP